MVQMLWIAVETAVSPSATPSPYRETALIGTPLRLLMRFSVLFGSHDGLKIT